VLTEVLTLVRPTQNRSVHVQLPSTIRHLSPAPDKGAADVPARLEATVEGFDVTNYVNFNAAAVVRNINAGSFLERCGPSGAADSVDSE
jgi:hypothetical protein